MTTAPTVTLDSFDIAILAALPELEQQELLKRTRLEPLTPYTITDPGKLMEQVHLAADLADHYAMAAMYLRMNGMLPPTAQKKE